MRSEYDPVDSTTETVEPGSKRDEPARKGTPEANYYRRRYQARSCNVLAISFLGILLVMIGLIVIVSADLNEPGRKGLTDEEYAEELTDWAREARATRANGRLISLVGVTAILASLFGAAVYCENIPPSVRGMMILGASLITLGLTLAVSWI